MNILHKIKDNIGMAALVIVISLYSVYISSRYLEVWLYVRALEIKVSYYQGAHNMAQYRHCNKYNPDLIDLERLRGIDGFVSCAGMSTYLDAFDGYDPNSEEPKKPAKEQKDE